MTTALDLYRNTKPTTADALHDRVRAFTGVRIAREQVCVGHQPPFDAFAAKCLHRPPITLELGGRGTGKSFGEALTLHEICRDNPGHPARILGGSKDQSRQIYEALSHHIRDGHGPLGSDGGPDVISDLLVERARYRNGSEVRILAASNRSVRGPHVPTLALDEVDEIDPALREAAMGMNMAMGGMPASVHMTSTCHKPSGPMAGLIDEAKSGSFPLYTYCTFEVLERCPTSRSGPNLEKCPDCPLFEFCWADRFNDPQRPPKAKLSNGHYAIDSLIQKVTTTSRRTFEADYLCLRPRQDGIWFRQWSERNVSDTAGEYNPYYPVHLAIDSGVRTGAVWFQVIPDGEWHTVNVFADYYADDSGEFQPNEIVDHESTGAYKNAKAILSICESLCGNRRDFVSTDPAGKRRTSTGPAVLAEYDRAGLKRIDPWPIRGVTDSLALLESFVSDAAGNIRLFVHSRCKHLIAAFESYRRSGKAPQWSDLPADPQHPAEDMIDALRGGLCHRFPDGRRPKRTGPTRRLSGLIT